MSVGVYLRNAAGFFLEIFPCVMLVFLPFSEESFRFHRKRVLLGEAAAVTVLSALFPAAMYAAAQRDMAVAANIFMGAVILLTLIAQGWLIREAPIKKTMAVFAVVFYGVTQYWLVNMLIGAVSGLVPLSQELENWSVYSPCGLAMYAVTTVILLPLMLLLVIQPLSEYLQEIETKKMRQEFFILAATTVVFLLLVMAADISYYRVGYRAYHRELPQLLVALMDQLAIYWLIFRESVWRKRDSDHQRALEIQQLQYEKIISDMENTRRMSHDLRHHYSSLNEMLQDGRLDEMKRYLSQVLDDNAKRMNEVYCEDMAVNGLLQYYAGVARAEGIRCDIQAQCDNVTIAPTDLTVVFGNAMENAVNACRKCGQDRWILVRVGTVQGSLAIEISNACSGVCISRREQTEDGFLPAEAFLSERANGGYGLRSIAQTAQKYGGSARFRYDAGEDTFTSRIRLNMPTE